MTINRLLAGSTYTEKERKSLNWAYRLTLESLGLVERGDPLCEFIARKVIEVRARGVTNVSAISRLAIKELKLN
ncbi:MULTISPECIES: hypothetical protein [Bradyrhizobium]|uniref:hypothetical protein n=1 Tax=Bradyrhizobium TaxID=374 RepID=UPI00114388F6|nr:MULTISPECIES: hypothetical protein [Bradyrhizobium]MCA6105025.1 hypothetical protein [Bradyrhizobium australafricanum]